MTSNSLRCFHIFIDYARSPVGMFFKVRVWLCACFRHYLWGLTNTAEALMIAVLEDPADFADDGGDPGDVTDDVVHQSTQSQQSNPSKEQEPKSQAKQEALRRKGKEVTDCRWPTTDDVYRAQFMPQLAVPVVVLSVLDDALSVGATPAATPSLLVFSKSKVMQRMCTWYHLFNWLCG